MQPEVVRDGARRRAVGLGLALLAALAVVAVWWFFVTTATGQRLDEVAYEGSWYGRRRLWTGVQPILDVVSVPFLVVVILVAGGFAAVRGRWAVALAAAVLVGGANVSTQLLKYALLTRPDLGVSYATVNSLPSGHTTVAASVAAAALLVAPPRWRGTAAVLGAGYAAATGIATLAGGWHRASDVVAALLVAAAWGLLAHSAVGTTTGHGAELASLPRRPAPRTAALLLGAGALGPGLVALVSLAVTWAGSGSTRTEHLIAYGGAAAGVLAVACATFLAMLLVAPPADGRPRR